MGCGRPYPAPVSGTPGYGQIRRRCWGQAGMGAVFGPGGAGALFSTTRSTHVFLTYDDVESEAVEDEVCADNKLAGVMFWQYTQDRTMCCLTRWLRGWKASHRD